MQTLHLFVFLLVFLLKIVEIASHDSCYMEEIGTSSKRRKAYYRNRERLQTTMSDYLLIPKQISVHNNYTRENIKKQFLSWKS